MDIIFRKPITNERRIQYIFKHQKSANIERNYNNFGVYMQPNKKMFYIEISNIIEIIIDISELDQELKHLNEDEFKKL